MPSRSGQGFMGLVKQICTSRTALAVAVAVPIVLLALRARQRRRLALLSTRSLQERVEELYAAQLADGNIIPLVTRDLAVVSSGSMPFVVSLRSQRGSSAKSAGGKKKSKSGPRDAFASHGPNPLAVATFGSTHKIVLNKFPAIKHHVVIHTSSFVPQEGHLSWDDMMATWHVVNQLDGVGYFNSGPLSGASQPRRHTQVIPLRAIEENIGDSDFPPLPVEVLISSFRQSHDWKYEAGRPFKLPEFGFQHAVSLNGDVLHSVDSDAADTLFEHYQRLLKELNLHLTSDTDQSYNFIVTRHWMMVVPRSSETWRGIGLNAMAYTGLFILPPEALSDFKASPFAALSALSVPNFSDTSFA